MKFMANIFNHPGSSFCLHGPFAEALTLPQPLDEAFRSIWTAGVMQKIPALRASHLALLRSGQLPLQDEIKVTVRKAFFVMIIISITSDKYTNSRYLIVLEHLF